MKKKIFNLIMIMALISVPMMFTSCEEEEIYYSMGFDTPIHIEGEESLDSISEDPIQDILSREAVLIESTFQKKLGVRANSFTRKGKVETCDTEVKTACEKAKEELKDKITNGFEYYVENNTTGKEIFRYTFGKTK